MVKVGWVDAQGCWVYLWHSEGEMANLKNRCKSIRCQQGRWYMDDLLWLAQLAVGNRWNIWSMGGWCPCQWLGGWLGMYGLWGVTSQSIPNAIAWLSTNLDPQNYDLSDMGPGANVVGEVYLGDVGVEEDEGISTSTSVNSMSRAFFLMTASCSFCNYVHLQFD